MKHWRLYEWVGQPSTLPSLRYRRCDGALIYPTQTHPGYTAKGRRTWWKTTAPLREDHVGSHSFFFTTPGKAMRASRTPVGQAEKEWCRCSQEEKERDTLLEEMEEALKNEQAKDPT